MSRVSGAGKEREGRRGAAARPSVPECRACRGQQRGTVVVSKRQAIGQQAHGLQPGSRAGPALQVTDPVAAESGALGQVFLGQRRGAAQLAQQIAERCRAARSSPPYLAPAVVAQGRALCAGKPSRGQRRRTWRHAGTMQARCMWWHRRDGRMLGACQGQAARPLPGKAFSQSCVGRTEGNQ